MEVIASPFHGIFTVAVAVPTNTNTELNTTP